MLFDLDRSVEGVECWVTSEGWMLWLDSLEDYDV